MARTSREFPKIRGLKHELDRPKYQGSYHKRSQEVDSEFIETASTCLRSWVGGSVTPRLRMAASMNWESLL